MEIKEFVKSVLRDVTEAVEEIATPDKKHIFNIGSDSNGSRNIEFDIAVSVSTTNETTGGGGIKVLEVIQGGASVSKESTNSSVSRIRFKINAQRV